MKNYLKIVTVFLAIVSLTQFASTGKRTQSASAKTQINEKTYAEFVTKGDHVSVKNLIALGADVDTKINGVPVLISAVLAGSLDVVKTLLEAGANPNAVDDDSGYSAIAFAASAAKNNKGAKRQKYLDMIRELFLHDAKRTPEFDKISWQDQGVRDVYLEMRKKGKAMAEYKRESL